MTIGDNEKRLSQIDTAEWQCISYYHGDLKCALIMMERNDSVTILQCNANNVLPCYNLSVYRYHSLSLCNIRNVLTLSFSCRSHKFNSPFHDMKVRMVSTSLLPSKVRIVEVIREIRPLQLVNFIKGWPKRWIAEWEDCRPNKCQSRIYIQTCLIWSLTCWGHSLCKSQVGSPDGRSQVRDF